MPSITGDRSKLVEIMSCLCEPKVDLWLLRELCLTDGGLLHDSVRQNAWPKLVGLQEKDIEEEMLSARNGRLASGNGVPSRICLSKKDESQIAADASRSQCHMLLVPPETENYTDEAKEIFRKKVKKRQRRLKLLIKNTLEIQDRDAIISEYDYDSAVSTAYLRSGMERQEEDSSRVDEHERLDVELKYYQGFHDVASVVLGSMYVSGEEMSFAKATRVLHRIGKCYLRDALRNDFKEIINSLKMTIFPLIAELGDYQLHDYLIESDQEPYFALGWVITWFSHDIRKPDIAKRIFDACLASHPLLPIYLSVAMMMHPYNRKYIMENDESDFASVHNRLCHLPQHSCAKSNESPPRELVPIQELMNNAISYMRRVPPRNLLKVATNYKNGDLISTVYDAKPSLLFPPDRWREWALTSSLPSDWFVRHRQDSGIDNDHKNEPDCSKESDENSLAYAASGLGDGDKEKLSLCGDGKKPARLVIGGVAAAVVTVGLYSMLNEQPDNSCDTTISDVREL